MNFCDITSKEKMQHEQNNAFQKRRRIIVSDDESNDNDVDNNTEVEPAMKNHVQLEEENDSKPQKRRRLKQGIDFNQEKEEEEAQDITKFLEQENEETIHTTTNEDSDKEEEEEGSSDGVDSADESSENDIDQNDDNRELSSSDSSSSNESDESDGKETAKPISMYHDFQRQQDFKAEKQWLRKYQESPQNKEDKKLFIAWCLQLKSTFEGMDSTITTHHNEIIVRKFDTEWLQRSLRTIMHSNALDSFPSLLIRDLEQFPNLSFVQLPTKHVKCEATGSKHNHASYVMTCSGTRYRAEMLSSTQKQQILVKPDEVKDVFKNSNYNEKNDYWKLHEKLKNFTVCPVCEKCYQRLWLFHSALHFKLKLVLKLVLSNVAEEEIAERWFQKWTMLNRFITSCNVAASDDFASKLQFSSIEKQDISSLLLLCSC
jgi:hypothetical protein